MMLKTTYILFVIYITAINAYERKGYPDYIYKENVGGWMKLHDKPVNWQTADETCKKEDAVLVASQYNEVDQILIQIVKDSNKVIDFLYIGRKAQSGPVKKEEEAINYTNVKEKCIVFFTNNATQKAVACSEEHAFVCYAPRLEPEECDLTAAGQDREGYPGYHRCNDLGVWVKIDPGPKDFDEANKTCKEEGGELINPDDPRFKEISLKLIKANSTDANQFTIYGKTKVTHPHGGFVEKNGRMVYVKVLPPYCTLLYPNGTLDHRVSCDQKVGFICVVPFPDKITTTTLKPDIKDDDTCGTGPDRKGSPGYKKCKDGDGWVKVHPGPSDQDEAKKTCDKEGAVLIDPSDPKFKEIAMKLLKKNPITIFGNNTKLRPDEGFSKEGGKTRFLKKKQQFCTVLYPNGTVDDEVNCDQKAGFICYIPFEDDNICTGDDRIGYEGYKGCKDGWVKVHPGPNDYDESKETCDKEGGVMIDTNDPKFKKIALKLIKRNNTLVFGKNRKTHPGSGLKKIGGKTKFLKKYHELCTILYPNGTIDDEVDCDKKFGFICYVPYPVAQSCGDGDYTYVESTGKCYKVYSIGKTWGESRKHCQVDGGDLVIVKSEKEATVLQDIYANHDMEYVVNHPTHMWAGILEKNAGLWTTVEDETLDAAGYNVWVPGKPANLNGVSQSCGGINMLGKYINCWCELKHGYICQKKATVSKIFLSPVAYSMIALNHLDNFSSQPKPLL